MDADVIRRLRAAGLGLALLASSPALAQSYDPYQALGPPRPIDRLMEYERGGQRRLVHVDGRLMVVMIHPREPALLIQRNPGAALMQGAAEGLSLGTVPAALAEDVYRRAAQAVLKPAGCRVIGMRSLDGRVSWEAQYACPAGVRIGRQKTEPRP